MIRYRTAFLLLALAPTVLAYHAAPVPAAGQPWMPADAIVRADTAFARTIERLSEPGGYFDSDNLISNEASYLHVLGGLRQVGTTGGAYIGVGPDQNFSYIAHVRPRIAYLIDIRRDNLLHHLLYKALFAHARNRVEYLALLTGRPSPDDVLRWDDRSLADIVAYIDAQAPDPQLHRATAAHIRRTIRAFGVPLDTRDLDTIENIHRAFHDAALDLRFTSFGRGPRPYYPTLRQLLLETDRDGNQGSYLASERNFRFVKSLQQADRIIPVVGDLGGDHALRAIGADIRERGERVSAFYTSNVEYYLMGDRKFDSFLANLLSLPRDERSVIIRSYFSRGYPHPQSVPGFYSTQLLETLDAMIDAYENDGLRTYFDLVNRGG
jgi:hypothetical protein